MTFGEKLKAVREERGLSLRDLSKTSGLFMSHIQYLENDARTPNESTQHRLARGLGVSPEEFVDEHSP
jgi:transcriptional regulator with XRE-family HTH domain